jgi:hypothetical protein
MTLQPIPSEFPYLWGKFDFLSVYKLLMDENKGENKNFKNSL